MKKLLVQIVAKDSKEVNDSFSLDYIEDEAEREMVVNEMLYNYAIGHHYNVQEFFSTHYRIVTDYIDSYDLVGMLEKAVHDLQNPSVNLENVRVVEIQLPYEIYKALSGTAHFTVGTKLVPTTDIGVGWFIGIPVTMHTELKKIRYVLEEC